MLLLSESFAGSFNELQARSLANSHAIEDTRTAACACSSLCKLAKQVKSVIEEQGFIQIRGFNPQQAKNIYAGLATSLGTPYLDPALDEALVKAHVQPSAELMGNQLRNLPLHTDYSMFSHPPKLTMSLCIEQDPLLEGVLRLSDVEGAIFGIESDPKIQRFLSVKLPFAGLNSSGKADVIHSPIISKINGKFLLRYHRSRITQGFKELKTTPTEEQTGTILEFEKFTLPTIVEITPQKADITIIDNHRMLHGRSKCNVIIDDNGTAKGRKMEFLFVNENEQ